MIEKINDAKAKFEWIDLIDPTEKELEDVAETYKLHKMTVKDCLYPHHFPKYEKFENGFFILVRAYDSGATNSADSVRQLTRKLAIFVTDTAIITIHRQAFGFVADVKEKFRERCETKAETCTIWTVLNELLHASIRGYETPLQQCQNYLEEFEFSTLKLHEKMEALDVYTLIRRSSVIKRMLTLFLNVVHKIENQPAEAEPFFNDMKEDAEHLLWWATDIFENTNRIMQLQISLQSQRTNETMRVLTLFSVFFMPLNFVTGVYGMNFPWMPFLQSHSGFYFVIVLFSISALVVYLWFIKKKWIH